MYKALKWWVLAVLAVVAYAAWNAFPLEQRINLGLDLQGGMHLVLRVDTSKLDAESKEDATERALEIIRNRIDEFGVKEPSIHRQGEEGIVVQLPGISDRDRALDIVKRTAHLEFKLVADDGALLGRALSGDIPAGYELKRPEDGEPILLESQSPLTGEGLATAMVQFNESRFNEPIVALRFNPRGARRFADLTAKNVGRRLAIVLDGNVHSAPRINEAIPSGEAVISGRFTPDDARDLALVLRVGALPAPVVVEEERTVGPLLGQDSIRKGFRATLAGGILVLIFMSSYYLLSGLISCVALVLNLLLIMGGLGLMGATLTLPGIAGILLTLGMAVDANVLINERIREEVKLGRTVRQSITNGYARAFTAILDSNVTTLIAAFLLFQFGTGPIRGFAVTLTIGLMASFFTAVVVTRVILELLLKSGFLKKLPMIYLVRPTSFNFLGLRKFCFIASLVAVVAGAGFFVSKGSGAYGIDFTGGQLQHYGFQAPVEIEPIRRSVREAGVMDASIQRFGDPKEVIVRTSEDTLSQVREKLQTDFPENPPTVLRVEQVGPSVGADLRNRAFKAIVWAIVGISLYVGFRFKRWSYGIAAVVALLHDVIIALGALALTDRTLSLVLVAGLLTIAGYSINDTIVVFDRLREILKTVRKTSFPAMVNLAINQTLPRTVLTSVTTLLAVLALFLYGGEVLNPFAFALLIGFISGTYSTIFIATPLLIAWSKKGRR